MANKFNKTVIGRNSIKSVQFSILGSDDIEKEAHGITTNKSLFSDGKPVPDGLYNPHYGSIAELGFNCQTCFNNQLYCPGHDGVMKVNYPLQNSLFRIEIPKWLYSICHNCYELVIPYNIPHTVLPHNRLKEYSKKVRTGDKNKKCHKCGFVQPYLVKDKENPALLWKEKNGEREIMYNTEIQKIFNNISDDIVIQLGKSLTCHPSKLLIDNIKISTIAVRPEIRKINGNKSSMSDITIGLKAIIDINNQIPLSLPENIEDSLHKKLILIDLTLYEMIRGTNAKSGNLKLVTNTNKISNSFASRLPKKTGFLRGSLTGKKVHKMGRSVIVGDNSLRPNQIGIPEMMAKNLLVIETVESWNVDKMTKYFENGPNVYPGCVKIIRKETGEEYYIDKLPKNYKLQYGDKLHRHIVDGDTFCFNRQPSLWWCSIAAFSVKVITGLALRFNSMVCVIFNADYDGDEMNVLAMSNTESIVETRVVSGIHNWFIKYQDSRPMLGLFHDSIIGAFEMTRSKVNNIHKFHAMNMCNKVKSENPLKFNKKSYTSRELISMFLPNINMEKDAGYYEPELEPYIKYRDDEKKIIIENGKFIQGVLDKSSIGQGKTDSLFHIIYLEKGATAAIDCMYNLQQLINNYMFYQGATFGIDDIFIDNKIKSKIKIEVQKIIDASNKLADDYKKGLIVPPLGINLDDYYEDLQQSVLEHGDEFIIPIIENIDPDNNWLYKFIVSGSKGTKSNMKSIFSAIGSIAVKGKRIKMDLDDRTSINFQRYDTDPISRGYNPNSFTDGIGPLTFPFAAMESRHELIEVALGTAIGGDLNRNAIKNFEDILIDNTKGSVKKNRLVQNLYGGHGFDPRKLEYVKFPTVKISDKDFEDRYRTKLSDVDKKWRNKNVKNVLDEEFNILLDDRKYYRKTYMKVEYENRQSTWIFSDKLKSVLNIPRIITNLKLLCKKNNISPTSKIDPVKSYKMVKLFTDSIGFLYFSENYKTKCVKNNIELPSYIQKSVKILQILIRSNLSISTLLRNKIDNNMLDLIFKEINYKISNAFISAGTSIGVIAAQCIGEPITQHYLDARHRSGLTKGKGNKVDKFKDILNVRDLDKAKTLPTMHLEPLEKYKYDKQKVLEIANYIEMLNFGIFVSDVKIFVETFGEPEHEDFKHESKYIKKFLVMSMGSSKPSNLSKWCIRYSLKRETLILKNMKLRTIYLKFIEKFPNYFVVYFDDGDELIFRIYMKSELNITETSIMSINDNIQNTTIRGIDGIYYTEVIDIPETIIGEDGEMKIKKYYCIETDGSNLSAILENKYLDVYKCYSTNIAETERIFGLVPARNKIISELNIILDGKPNKSHITIYADEMIYTGKVTGIQRSGLSLRESNKVLLRATYGSPVQVFQKAAIDNQTDQLHGISSVMVMGTTPEFGTTYNHVFVNPKLVEKFQPSTKSIIDDL